MSTVSGVTDGLTQNRPLCVQGCAYCVILIIIIIIIIIIIKGRRVFALHGNEPMGLHSKQN